MRIKGVFVAFAAIVAMSSSAMPAPQNTASMTIGAVTSQPIGHYEFCQRHTDECGPTRNAGPLDMNATTWALVNQINLRVNKTITPAPTRKSTARKKTGTIRRRPATARISRF